jgi:hypothetical protein
VRLLPFYSTLGEPVAGSISPIHPPRYVRSVERRRATDVVHDIHHNGAVTYFAPDTEKRVDGLPAMRTLLLPKTGKIKIDRYEMINPIVQFRGDDFALLSFNIVNYQRQPNGSEQAIRRWNVTEAYSRINGQWRIVHSHFSYVQPELKQPARVG